MKFVTTTAFALLLAASMIHARGSDNITRHEQTPKEELFLDPTADQLKAAKPANNIHCPVDGADINAKSMPVEIVYRGSIVRLDCAACKPEFARKPGKYTALAITDTAKTSANP